MRSKLLVLSVAAVLTISACGTSGGSDDASSDETTTEATTTTAAPEEETTTTEAEAEGVDVEEWADGFCGSFSTWLDEINAASESVGSSSITDLESAKAAVADLFGTASSVTEDLIADLEANGAPDIEDGDQLVADLTEKFQAFVDAADGAESSVAALDASSPTFQADATDLITLFQDEVGEVSQSFEDLGNDYPSAELNAAISSSCNF